MNERMISRIKGKERRRLKLFLQDAPASTRGAVESIVEELVTLKALIAQASEAVETCGFTEIYDNGGGQRGRRRSLEFDALLRLQKNYGLLHGRLVSLIVATVVEEGDDA